MKFTLGRCISMSNPWSEDKVSLPAKQTCIKNKFHNHHEQKKKSSCGEVAPWGLRNFTANIETLSSKWSTVICFVYRFFFIIWNAELFMQSSALHFATFDTSLLVALGWTAAGVWEMLQHVSRKSLTEALSRWGKKNTFSWPTRRCFPTCGSGPCPRFLRSFVTRVASCEMAAAGGVRGFEWVTVGPFQLPCSSLPNLLCHHPHPSASSWFWPLEKCSFVRQSMSLWPFGVRPWKRAVNTGAAAQQKLQYDSDQWLFEVGAINR